MANIKLQKKKKPSKFNNSSISRKSNFLLPVEQTIIADELGQYSFLLYGAGKIGKTSFVAQFPDPYFLMFDPLKRGMKLKQSRIKDWDTLLEAIGALEANPNYCQTVVFDTGYEAYDKCYQWMLTQFGVENFKDAPFGFWKEVEREFKIAHTRIMDAGFGFIATAHCDEEEVVKFGMSHHVTTTQLGKQATRYYTAEMDIIGYYHYDSEGKRFLQISGDADTLAGTRTEGKFLYTDGTPVRVIDMRNSAKEAYAHFLDAFNNRLINPKNKKGGESAGKKRFILKRGS